MTSTDTYQLKWHSHSTHMNGSVASLLRSEKFTDVVLCTMDGSQIPAHKFILSSCSVYLSSLFEGQRAVTRMGGMLYVVLPSEISTKALKTLVEYMYKGETTVSNEVLDTVLKAGEVLKIRGLWRQADDGSEDTVSPADKPTNNNNASANLQPVKKSEEILMPLQPKINVKKDDKIVKTLNNPTVQTPSGPRPMFIGPPKLVFIKTNEGTGQTTIRHGAPKNQTILVAQPPKTTDSPRVTPMVMKPDLADGMSMRLMRRQTVEKKYGKKQRAESNTDETRDNKNIEVPIARTASKSMETMEVQVKEEPNWDSGSIEEEERSIADLFQVEMSVKAEPGDGVDIEEEGLIYSPLACELCSEVFTQPAAWVRHVEAHAKNDPIQSRKRRHRADDCDDDDSTALLRCDLCQKHFLNPAEWVRHIKSTHTETELAISNNSAPPMRRTRFTDMSHTKICTVCQKICSSHASMLIHMRTHTGEQPFVCGLCNSAFNVRSNLMRHLRTVHDPTVEEVDPLVDTDDEDTLSGTGEVFPHAGPSHDS